MNPDIKDLSIPHWIIENNIVNERGDPIEFRDHLFLFDILADTSRFQVIKKCVQVGATVAFTLKSAFFCKKGKMNVIYTMPSDEDVSDFVKTKADMIFKANPELRDDFKSDTIGLKQIGDRFIYYNGTKSKTASLSKSADLLIHDEIDRSDLKIVEQFRSRLANSDYKGIWYLSNPSIVGVGIDEFWQKSDKKEWFITCKGCGLEQYLKWEDNIDEINKKYVCKDCGKEFSNNDRRLGHWIATDPGKEMSGYHISQMMSPKWTVSDLLREKEDKGEDYFRNFYLGEPYSAGEDIGLRQAITDIWTDEELEKNGPYYMGIDIGNIKHYVIGSRKGIFEIGVCRTREELEKIIDKWNPTWVMDSGPERTWAEEFKKKYPKGFLNFYHADKDKAEIIRWGGEGRGVEDRKNWGYVWTDRTRIIDKVIYEMLRGNFMIGISREHLEKYIKHWESMRKIIEESTDKTKKRYTWITTNGIDHWCHATVYYYLAMQRGNGKFEFESEKNKDTPVIERTDNGFKMNDLKDIIESIQQQNDDI